MVFSRVTPSTHNALSVWPWTLNHGLPYIRCTVYFDKCTDLGLAASLPPCNRVPNCPRGWSRLMLLLPMKFWAKLMIVDIRLCYRKKNTAIKLRFTRRHLFIPLHDGRQSVQPQSQLAGPPLSLSCRFF